MDSRHINTKLLSWRHHNKKRLEDFGSSPNTSSNDEGLRTSHKNSSKTRSGKKTTRHTQDTSQELAALSSTLSLTSNISVGLKQGTAEQKDGGTYTELQKAS